MIIFDLDGTLWDSAEQVAQSWNLVFRQFGSFAYELLTQTAEESRKYRSLPEASGDDILRLKKMMPSDEETARLRRLTKQIDFPHLTADDIKNVMGKTMAEIAQVTMPDMDPEDRRTIFKLCETYEVTYLEYHEGTLFAQVRETLARLKAQGHDLAIVSNCQTGYVEAFLKSMNMKDVFCDYEEWGRTGRPKGENIRLVMERNGCSEAVYVGDTQKDKDAADAAGIPFIWASYGFGTVDCCAAELKRFSELPAVCERLFNS